jgi:glucose-6-phosphate isomerase
MQSKQHIWQQLTEHQQMIAQQSMRSLFTADPTRVEQFSLSAANLYLDYSKNHINKHTVALLLELARACDLEHWIQKMFAGEKINLTENRAVLHTALRNRSTQPMMADGVNVMSEVRTQLAKMRKLVTEIHDGIWLGFTGRRITDIVNIGIGGSDLGPRMVVKALSSYHTGHVRCHFVANVDGSDLFETLKHLDPETTLFIVASKSFSTQETLMNAVSARNWLLNKTSKPSDIAKHFIAISSRLDKVEEFGIDANNCFAMWDWVGGRYSLWSSIGLPIALSVGMDQFENLLTGAYDMDCHFRTTDLHHNMPVILALLGIWHINFFGCQSQAILPYDEYLQLLPNYLQQADMESNGKSVDRDGKPLQINTAAVIWGGVGTNGQHAFHQLLHQGTLLIPADFIIAARNHHDLAGHHEALIANCLAQSQALMQGKTAAEAMHELIQQGKSEADAKTLAPHKVIAGNKPNNMLVLPELTPSTLGALLALYEHKIFVQSIIWNINAFDQWGVELGKQLAEPILQALFGHRHLDHTDQSTANLIHRLKPKKL